MNTVFEESGLRFTFDEQWRVFQYDTCPHFLHRMQETRGSAAVDFIGLHGKALYLFEVKNLRHTEWQTPEKIEGIARKVRDTVAGAVGAARLKASPVETWPEVVRCLTTAPAAGGPKEAVHVLAWIELPRLSSLGKTKGDYQKSLSKKLRWLNADVLLLNSHDPEALRIPGLSVTRLPYPPP